MAENNLLDIQQRITAAKQTRKITSTMELIASSRLHRGKILLSSYQDWARQMREAARCLPDSYFEPLPGWADGDEKAYIIFGGSKGLSGSYGPNLLQYAAPIVNGHTVVAVGSAAATFFPDAHSSFGDQNPSAEKARDIVQIAKTLYESKTVNEVYLIYMSGSRQISERLFPLSRIEEHNDMIIVEPSEKMVFPELYNEYIETIVYEAYLQAFVSEQISRFSAMDSATQNAGDIIEGLQSSYNRIRQTAITQEIIMVSNAARGGEA